MIITLNEKKYELKFSVGEYEICAEDGTTEKRYGLKAFSPIAKGFEYRDYDDFGVSRTYGFKREHLGHKDEC